VDAKCQGRTGVFVTESRLIFMQDRAPRHSAKATQAELNKRGIYLTFPPDLSRIETVWDRMKDYIERHYPEYYSTHDKLRRVVKEAWEAVGADELLAL
jgi:transposase